MFKELRQKYGGETPEPEKPAKANLGEDMEPEASPPQDKAPTEKEGGAKTVEKPDEKKKTNPWKLVDEHKAARLKAETELAELRKAQIDPVKSKEQEERFKTIEQRNKELEDEIRYVNYQKSSEFKEKYQKPYEQAWSKWMSELGELMVTDSASGAERPIKADDILELVNLPLQKARQRATDVYGAFADDVMSARKEIRSLFDAQQTALEEARKTGEGWHARIQQEAKQRQQAMSKELSDNWRKFNEAAVADERYGKFFKPVEGDEDGNKRLSKGFEMADKAFAVNPFDPRLTPEQRAEIVQLHSAVRNRAAAFGRLSVQNQRLEAKVKELSAELDKYKAVEPPAAGGQEQKKESGHSSAHDEVFSALRKFAH